jgi:UDP-N-acetylglucosamine acyltransferase
VSTRIHPTAIVDPAAELDTGVELGAYAIVGPRVRIGSGTRVGAHAVIEGRTSIGQNNRIFHHASVGAIPQDLKYHGEDSDLVIGDGNTIREFVTLHRGTEGGGMTTRVGNRNLLMNYCHIAHDCILGDSNVIANGAQLGGHVTIEDFVVVGALSGVHQFVTVGESAILGAGTMASLDIPPFCNATGDRATLHGLNLVGLKRRGFGSEPIRALKLAYRIMFHSRLRVGEAAARVRREVPPGREVERFVAFIERSARGVCRPGRAAE